MTREQLIERRAEIKRFLSGKLTTAVKVCPRCEGGLWESHKATIHSERWYSDCCTPECHVFFCETCGVAYSLDPVQRGDRRGFTAGRSPLHFVRALVERREPIYPTERQRERGENTIRKIDAALALIA